MYYMLDVQKNPLLGLISNIPQSHLDLGTIQRVETTNRKYIINLTIRNEEKLAM